ncbi:hypothetical protein, unlikely [Trypanosoma congolense IL3000]|uniref:Uncharacterized protein n=1 Tax=Trypanosoma congolense (strain IL3000) TaxID=1068625 RepID=F9WB92_TRYCI|nr:hypothetical protein, unlikely [Trypanosoma congolense IL3000]
MQGPPVRHFYSGVEGIVKSFSRPKGECRNTGANCMCIPPFFLFGGQLTVLFICLTKKACFVAKARISLADILLGLTSVRCTRTVSTTSSQFCKSPKASTADSVFENSIFIALNSSPPVEMQHQQWHTLTNRRKCS